MFSIYCIVSLRPSDFKVSILAKKGDLFVWLDGDPCGTDGSSVVVFSAKEEALLWIKNNLVKAKAVYPCKLSELGKLSSDGWIVP